jgi:hypothetical protein
MRSSAIGSRGPVAMRDSVPALATGDAPGGVHLVTDMDALIAGLLTQAKDIGRGELGGAVSRVFESAVRRWPVDTGYSRSRLEMRRLPDGGAGLGERYQIAVDAWYAGYIRTKGTHVVTTLLRDPLAVEVAKAAQNIAAKMGGT